MEAQKQIAKAKWPYSLLDGSEMAKLAYAFDWSTTSLGAIESWPQSLRVTASMALSNSFPMAILWGDEYIQLYNDAFIPIAGHNHPSMLGNYCWDTWAEVWQDILEPAILTVKQTGKAVITENQHFPVLRFGYMEEVYCLIAYSPLRNEQNEIEGVLITISETTGQVLGERRLKTLRSLGDQASKARTPEEACEIATETLEQSAVADIPFALIYLLNETGKQAHLVALTGLARGGIVSPETIVLSSDEHEPWCFTRALLSGPQQINDLEARYGKLPGGFWPESPREAIVFPLESQTQERPVGFLVVGVSPRRELDEQYHEFLMLVGTQIANSIANAQAYEQERRRAEALTKLDQAKTAFFSNVSHEFRTPLSLILGPIEEVLNDPGLPSKPRAQLDIMHRNALRLLKLVNSLLDFSRIEENRIQASYHPTDLAALTLDLVSNFRSAIEKAGLHLRIDCPKLPEPIYTDCDMWEKIVLNLLSNAFKHTFEGEIEISLKWMNDHVNLIVRDTGIGISADQLPLLFERFHRVPNARSRTHEGTGIGLALVKELVNLHGGIISVESLPEEGSTFTVSIPGGKAHLPWDRIKTPFDLPSKASHAQSSVAESLRWLPEASYSATAETTWQSSMLSSRSCIVLADDNADMLSYIKRLLEPFYDVIAVCDGEAALAIIKDTLPDLVLTDVMMPRLDGFALLRELRQNSRTRTLPVIMLSARAGEESSIEGLEAGATDYLVKPFSSNELLARVRTNLEMAKIRKESEEKVRQAEKMQVIGQLAGGVAHDFNSLLTVLIGRLEMLNKHVHDEAGQKMLYSASNVAERSARLVKQILAFARKQPLRLEQVNLNHLFLNMEDLLISTLGKENRLQKKLADNLEPVLIDANQMEMIILNLTLNSRDAMPGGGVLAIETRNEHENKTGELKAGNYVLLTISDTGTGMSQEVLGRAFEPFFTTKNVGNGTGLGLSQVYGTVNQLGGMIKLYSTLGKGTKVEILLPCGLNLT